MDSARKRAVREYTDAAGKGDIDKILSLVTEDFSHELLGSTAVGGKRTLSEVLELVKSFSAALASSEFIFHQMVEEGDLVAAIFSGRCQLVNGKRYDGDYALVCSFRGDKILTLRELVDTKLADSVLN
jgi:ketosteroid isomerase-like protein